MLDKETYLLNCLNEELGESVQRVSKAIRFGLNEIQDGQELTNLERLTNELNDILAVVEMLKEEGVKFPKLNDKVSKETKKGRVKWYMKRSIEHGRLILEQDEV